MRKRIVPILLLLPLLATPVWADVVVLEANDVPLTGVIVNETETHIEFKIKGLGDTSTFTIEKSRIKRYWREDTDHWEFRESEKAHEAAVRRVEQRKATERHPPKVLRFELPETYATGRSQSQVRADLIARAVDRLWWVVPREPLMQGVVALGAVLLLSLLIFIGGKVADLPSLSIQKSLVLSFLAGGAVVALTVVLPKLHLPPGLLPAFILTLTVVWLVAARLLSRGRFVKGIIMLSFVLATLFVAGSSVFGILAVV